jgi:hypothetical protein
MAHVRDEARRSEARKRDLQSLYMRSLTDATHALPDRRRGATRTTSRLCLNARRRGGAHAHEHARTRTHRRPRTHAHTHEHARARTHRRRGATRTTRRSCWGSTPAGGPTATSSPGPSRRLPPARSAGRRRQETRILGAASLPARSLGRRRCARLALR